MYTHSRLSQVLEWLVEQIPSLLSPDNCISARDLHNYLFADGSPSNCNILQTNPVFANTHSLRPKGVTVNWTSNL